VSGRVYLVGAGPGDPGLMTARALELIAAAEVIMYDRLIGPAALDAARPDAELLFVGKQGGGAAVPQEETEALMIRRAREGKTVVRLKGGDPFVFGRGGEEALALRAAGIPYEVVPGVTSGLAAPAYAGIPVTHRGVSSAVALVTAHASEETGLDWAALAEFPGTLVFYMAVRPLAQVASVLIAAGRDPEQPTAVIEAGTLAGQRTVRGRLRTIGALAADAAIGPPAVVVVGEVAALAGELSWLAQRPLTGRTIAVTRARAQASSLEGLGATVVQAPAIRVRLLDGPAPDLGSYDLICLTSANGVGALFERLDAAGRDARALAGARVAAIGAGTARALAERGIRADVVPERFVAESLVDALADLPVSRALIARARDARDVLPDALRARGAHVDVLELYETVVQPLPSEVLEVARDADYITFTSSSTVRSFLASASSEAGVSDGSRPGGLSERTRIVSIGPVTSKTLREAGLEVDVEAVRHDVGGLVQALLGDAQRRPG
jgi:uroporphyrinogen III methyltransferase / synthase